MKTRIEQAMDRAIQKAGNNIEAVVDAIMEEQEHDAALRQEVDRKAKEHIVLEIVDQVMGEGRLGNDTPAIVAEVLKRLRRRRFRVV